MSEEQQAPTLTVTVGAPVEAVWRSLRDPDLLRRWHGWHYGELDAEIAVIYGEGATADDERHTLETNGDRFEVVPVEGGCEVRLTRPPFRPGEAWSDYYDDVTEGWTTFLQQLRFAHEVHGLAERRTLFLAGRGAPDALDRLRSSLPTRAGEQEYAAAHQDGVRLPDLGPGLLVLGAKEPTVDGSGRPAVDAMAVVTTYGLDDGGFAAEAGRWTAWWRTGFPGAGPAQT